MSFAFIDFTSDIDSFMPENRYIKKIKLPQKFKNIYIKRNIPIKISDLDLLGMKGHNISIPYINDKEYIENATKLLYDTLTEMEVKSIKIPNTINWSYDRTIPACSGFYIWPFFLRDAIHKACKVFNKEVKKAEVLIIDGFPDLTLDIINILSEYINFLSVLSEESEYLEEKSENIIENCGLDLQVYSNDSLVESADIIINAQMELHGLESRFKRKAIYFDLAGNKEQTVLLAEKRKDMLIADGFYVRDDYTYIDNVTLETLLTCKYPLLRKYLYSSIHEEELNEQADLIKNLKLPFISFTRLSKSVSFTDLESSAIG